MQKYSDHIDKSIKSAFEYFEDSSSPKLWKGIANALDKDTLLQKNKILTRWLVAASTLVFFLTAYAITSNLPVIKKVISKKNLPAKDVSRSFLMSVNDFVPATDIGERDHADNSNVKEKILIKKKNVLTQIESKKFEVSKCNSHNKDLIINDNVISLNNERDLKQDLFLRYLKYKGFDDNMSSPLEAEILTVDEGYDDILDFFTHNSILPKGLYIGAFAGLNNVWIINQNAYNDFKGDELYYKADFGLAYGITTGYNFSDKFGLQVEWIINSQQGQKYEDVINNNRIRREVDLKYTQIPVLVKYKGSRLGGKGITPVSFNLLFGPYIGILKSANILTNNDPYPALDRFRKKDYGLIAGLEYEIYLDKSWSFSTAFRSTFGLRGIHTSEWQKYNTESSLNLAIGVNVGFKYLMIKK